MFVINLYLLPHLYPCAGISKDDALTYLSLIHAFLWDGDVHVANKRKGIVGGEDTAFPVTLESCLEGLVAFLHYNNLALGGRCDLHTLQVVILNGLSVSINFNILDAT